MPDVKQRAAYILNLYRDSGSVIQAEQLADAGLLAPEWQCAAHSSVKANDPQEWSVCSWCGLLTSEPRT